MTSGSRQRKRRYIAAETEVHAFASTVIFAAANGTNKLTWADCLCRYFYRFLGGERSSCMNNMNNAAVKFHFDNTVVGVSSKTRALAIIGMIFGILSVLTCGFPFVGMLFGIPGSIVSVKAQKNQNTKVGRVGVIASVLGFFFNMLITGFFLIVMFLVSSLSGGIGMF